MSQKPTEIAIPDITDFMDWDHVGIDTLVNVLRTRCTGMIVGMTDTAEYGALCIKWHGNPASIHGIGVLMSARLAQLAHEGWGFREAGVAREDDDIARGQGNEGSPA